MKVFRFALVAIVATLASFAPAFGQRVPGQPQGFVKRGETPLLSADAVEKLKFSGEQKDKYAKIETDYKEKIKAAQEKFRADIAGLTERGKYKEVFEKMQTDTKKAREDHLAKVEPILNAEQKTVFAQVRQQQPVQPGIRPILPIGGAGVGQILPPAVQLRLNLTDEQKKKIAEIQKDVEAKILKILNDEQKKQFEEIKKGGVRPRLTPARQRNPEIRSQETGGSLVSHHTKLMPARRP